MSDAVTRLNAALEGTHSDLYIALMRGCDPLRRVWPLVAAVAITACDGATAPEVGQVGQLSISPEAGLAVGVDGTQQFALTALDERGAPLGVEDAEWVTSDPTVATVESGRARGVAAGVTTVTAHLGGMTVSASLEVYVPDVVASYQAGVSYFGRNGYIEYIPGELPVVLSSPHDGDLSPAELRERTYGARGRDPNTVPLTLAVRDAVLDLTGLAPHVVISHLRRSKMDPNREVVEAAQGDPFAERAWSEYHAYIERSRVVIGVSGGGMYFDIHSHSHPIWRVELDYLLGGIVLDRPNSLLDAVNEGLRTSIREIDRVSPLPFSELLRGPTSFGGLLAAEGVRSVPSPTDPSPGSDPFFFGGYSNRRHGSFRTGEVVSGIMLEHPTIIVDSDANRRDSRW